MSYLTFDIGTTALKTALVSEQGDLLAVHTEEYDLRTPHPGWAEMDPQVYWRAAVSGTRSVLAGAGQAAGAEPVAALGFASQGQSFVALDRRGRPLREAIVWVDSRAEGLARRWEADWLSREDYRRLSGYPWLPAEMTLFKLAWLAEHDPVASGAWKFLFLPDYLIWRLTGETATDYNLAQMSGMYDLRTQQWSPRLLAAAQVSPGQLPGVRSPGEVAGALRKDAADELGLAPGLPVCLGCNDQLAGAVGAGNVVPGLVTETTGTALAVVATTERLLGDARLCEGRHAAPELYYSMTFSPTSAIALKWLRDLCAPQEDYDSLLQGVGDLPPGCEGLTMLPHFCGTATPTFNPRARGAFAGLTLSHTRAHLVRAVMESCACLLQECLTPLQESGQPPASVRSLGGAARSDLWLQMKADLLGISVERPAGAEAANLGAAMLAATGVGQFRSIQEAAGAWYRPQRQFLPQKSRFAAYRRVYDRYRDLYRRLYGKGPDAASIRQDVRHMGR